MKLGRRLGTLCQISWRDEQKFFPQKNFLAM